MQQNEELPAGGQTSSDSIQPSRPDVVYAHIVPQSQEPGLGNPYVLSNNEHVVNGRVIYSEILSKDNDVPTVAMSGDLYANVKKH